MADNFVGKWKQISRTNVDQLVDVYKIPADKRDFVKKALAEQDMELQFSGDTGTLTISTSNGEQRMPFTLGQPFDFYIATKRKVQAVLTTEDDSHIHIAVTDPDDPNFKGELAGQSTGQEMTMVQRMAGVESEIQYKKE